MSDYDSDPADALRPSRRRAASDDERQGSVSEDELDDDDDVDDLDDEVVSEEGGVDEDRGDLDEEGGLESVEDSEVVENLEVEGKKESEPSTVPTAGAFYMHDDRFGETARGRGRRRPMPGARNFWEAKDDQAWVHDRFEEMNLHDSHNDEQRKTNRGRFRGRANNRSRGIDHGYIRGDRSQAYDDNTRSRGDRSQAYDDNTRSRGERSQAYDDNTRSRGDRSQVYDDNTRSRGDRSQAYHDNSGHNNRSRRDRSQVYDDNSSHNNRSRGDRSQAYDDNTGHNRFRGDRSQAYDDNTGHNRSKGDRSQACDDNIDPQGYAESVTQNRAPRSVRGRGPRRYESLTKYTTEAPARRNKQSVGHHESSSSTSTRPQSSFSSNAQPDPVFRRKDVASSLSSASPPFYPSVSSNKDVSGNRKRDTRTGSNSKIISSSMQAGDKVSSPPGSLPRGKALIGSVGHNSRYPDNRTRQVSGKSSESSQQQSAGSSALSASPIQSHSRFQERGVSNSGQLNHQSNTALNQVTRASSQNQVSIVQPIQTPVQAVMQQMAQRSNSGFPASSPSQPLSANQYDVGETRAPPGASQVLIGNGEMGLTRSDQRFHPAPALLQLMQFGGQQHGGAGVPAVGMALPGYVAQQQLGFGNSEMTWVPVLAGGSGALVSPYGSPYITLDNDFYSHTSGQGQITSTISRESASKPVDTSEFPQDPESVTDESGQRQNKPRRYSEMNIGQ